MARRAKTSKRIRIFTVDEQPLVREGLKSALTRSGDAVVVGEASEWQAGAVEVKRRSPDVILLGSRKPRRALEAVHSLRKNVPDPKILMIGDSSDAELVFSFLKAGANGYLLNTSSTAELLRAIRTVHKGEVFLSPGVARAAPDESEAASTRESGSRKLSPRESQVLGLIARGLTNRQIGEKLRISTRTVETHRERIMRKLDIHTVAGLTRYAMEHGFNEES